MSIEISCNSRKRGRANSFIDNAEKIDNNIIFDYKNYLKLNKELDENKYKNYHDFKKITKNIHFKENDIVRIDEDSYIQEESYQNIKIVPDCFDDDGNIVDIFPSFREFNSIKIRNIPKTYNDYIQILLHILNLDKAVIHIYHLVQFTNTRDIRQTGIKLNDNNYGIIINKEGSDMYWVLEHVQKIVINRNYSFNTRKIRNINRNFVSMNLEKYVTPKHKKKKTNYLGPEWIAASKTRNAALNDHCLDYFRAYNIKDINDSPEKREFSFEPSSKFERINKTPENAVSFIDFLLTQGNVFEDTIIDKIKEKYKDNFVEICKSYESRDLNNYQKTVDEMKKGTPIIYQPVLYCYKHQVFGCADLIIRSDWINKIVKNKVLTPEEEKINSEVLEKDFHYRVIDVKFSKLHFNTDEKTLRNTSNVKPFKTQIALYNIALGEMQGYTPAQSYILGNGWIMSKTVNKKKILNKSEDPFNKLGTIDYNNRDLNYVDQSLNAISWLKELNESEDWNHDPPSDPRIYPNMCNTYDGIYHKVKNQIATKYNEITLIPQCGVSNRESAFSKNVTSWMDPKCNSDVLSITGEKTTKLVNNIIKFNQKKDKNISVDKIKSKKCDWRNKNKLTLYVDFETIGGMLLKTNNKTNIGIEGDYIFMIGLGWQMPNSEEWNYKCFYSDNISLTEEYKIMQEFNNKVKQLENSYGRCNMLHWSSAETIQYNRVNKRYGNIFSKMEWFDLMKFFKNNNIFILGALNFSLKTVAKKMYEYNMINTIWEDSECMNGEDAMFKSWQMYIKNDIKNDTFNDIIKYNEVDCKTLFEMLNFLRNNH